MRIIWKPDSKEPETTTSAHFFFGALDDADRIFFNVEFEDETVEMRAVVGVENAFAALTETLDGKIFAGRTKVALAYVTDSDRIPLSASVMLDGSDLHFIANELKAERGSASSMTTAEGSVRDRLLASSSNAEEKTRGNVADVITFLAEAISD